MSDKYPENKQLVEALRQHLKGDYNCALKELHPLVAEGVAEAQILLSDMYRQGHGGVQDNDRADKLLRQAEEKGLAEVYYNLGYAYYRHLGAWVGLDEGRGQKVLTESIKWFCKAAEQGHRDAQYHLGIAYSNDQSAEETLKTAFVWFYVASANGHKEATKKVNEAEEWSTYRLPKRKRPKLSQEDLADAKYLAQKCRDSNYTNCP